MHFFMPSCREAVRLQSRSLDGRLGPLDRMRLRVHLLICNTCRRYARQVVFLREHVFKDERLNVGVGTALSPEAKARMVEAMRKSGGD